MSKPEGNLTATQYEILEIVWDHGRQGATVADIWRAVAARRCVGRTTILNLVDRLEKRGWLVRRDDPRPYRYRAALDRSETNSFLTRSFVDGFFGGSASGLLISLLGSQRLTREEVRQLRRILEEGSAQGGTNKEA